MANNLPESWLCHIMLWELRQSTYPLWPLVLTTKVRWLTGHLSVSKSQSFHVTLQVSLNPFSMEKDAKDVTGLAVWIENQPSSLRLMWGSTCVRTLLGSYTQRSIVGWEKCQGMSKESAGPELAPRVVRSERVWAQTWARQLWEGQGVRLPLAPTSLCTRWS